MAENKSEESSNSDVGSGPFQKLEIATDHEDRAERLRAEAKHEVLEKVDEKIPFECRVTVTLKGKAFNVTCTPDKLQKDIDDDFDEEVNVTTPIRFTIGDQDRDQGERIKSIKELISDIELEYDEGAPVEVILERAADIGMDRSKAEHEIEKLKQKGEVYEPITDYLRPT
ncbi:hypothetical protein SAMN05421809_3745 [Natronorubrum daqingense]|uniref:MCM C-terminal domain-containing protein n=1 Tax=Natronorubrum daqingense TaxID=588898 RepID=A0A1N7G5F4_9EURY|nr:hypothetical protein SAMN05421809_3745 [Natronorubrum daqingense]